MRQLRVCENANASTPAARKAPASQRKGSRRTRAVSKELRIAASGETRRTASSGSSANITQMAKPSPIARPIANQEVWN